MAGAIDWGLVGWIVGSGMACDSGPGLLVSGADLGSGTAWGRGSGTRRGFLSGTVGWGLEGRVFGSGMDLAKGGRGTVAGSDFGFGYGPDIAAGAFGLGY